MGNHEGHEAREFTEKAISSGFAAVGFSRARRPPFFGQFSQWIAAGKQGEMGWLGKHLDVRENPKNLLEGCETVITLAYPYSSSKPCTPDGFSTARYSEPRKSDYHDRLRKLARNLALGIEKGHSGAISRICVDSAPLLERSFAHASGTGFIGKNNMFIVPGQGSYLFLAEILTTAPFPSSQRQPMENQCGACTRCLDACPTGALERPFFLDASKCLSYVTIEKPGVVSREAGRNMGACFFGCDVCQEVCPFNHNKDRDADLSLPSTERILEMKDEDFKREFGKTAFARAGLEKVKSNIRAVRNNSGDTLLI
ncbi:MAG: tRNA epoxyqueuosine(34) reductase QueG [Deltaproteobacteria bacterium]|nr:tRNA epoxyqueuosine(34) reductase QueG [Deltaproteobacteria bacterium]